MGVNKNKFIEDWNHARENLELTFRWTRRNLAIAGFFGVAVPILVYKGIVNEFVRSIGILCSDVFPYDVLKTLISNWFFLVFDSTCRMRTGEDRRGNSCEGISSDVAFQLFLLE
ncbi:hypothetical protein KFK09_003988 [Dendrobium nobile]|uniref:Uncharacterized protein n=1 Tax=Dendrobium nobile TaxID=94219 RepID=A0A8T3C4Q2_DENNO|nr:hypothetical protein KFK09_003988 [Dendrobium nobile]